MKAPLDWVQAIGRARSMGVNLHATWMGDGSLFDELKSYFLVADRRVTL